MEPDYFLPSAAARFLGVSYTSVKAWIYSGRLRAITISGGVRAVHRSDLEALAAERAEKKQAEAR